MPTTTSFQFHQQDQNTEGPEAEEQLVDAKRGLDLRASFCIDYHTPECVDAIVDCKPKCTDEAASDQCKYKPNELQSCCLGEFGKEADADQAVHDCIIEKVMSGTPEDKEAPTEPSQETVVSAACKKASAEYQVAVIEADCNEVEDNSVNEE